MEINNKPSWWEDPVSNISHRLIEMLNRRKEDEDHSPFLPPGKDNNPPKSFIKGEKRKCQSKENFPDTNVTKKSRQRRYYS